MPIYEFACQSCGYEFEHMQPFSAAITPNCTRCNSSDVVRRLGRPAIHFKGSGWYITDSKKNGASSTDKNGAEKSSTEKSSTEKSSTEKTGADKKSSDTSSAPAEAKSDSKPAAAPVAAD